VTEIYKIRSEIWVAPIPAPPPEIWRPQNIKISARFCTTLRLDREYLRNATSHLQSENALQTTDNPAQANLIRCTLVHKRRKIKPESWPTQRTAIRLGSATHLIAVCRHVHANFDSWSNPLSQHVEPLLVAQTDDPPFPASIMPWDRRVLEQPLRVGASRRCNYCVQLAR